MSTLDDVGDGGLRDGACEIEAALRPLAERGLVGIGAGADAALVFGDELFFLGDAEAETGGGGLHWDFGGCG